MHVIESRPESSMPTQKPLPTERPEPEYTNLLAELRSATHREAGLPPATHHRWKSGELPAAIRWLARHPRMMRALLRDLGETN
jgi:hypothetical protein